MDLRVLRKYRRRRKTVDEWKQNKKKLFHFFTNRENIKKRVSAVSKNKKIGKRDDDDNTIETGRLCWYSNIVAINTQERIEKVQSSCKRGCCYVHTISSHLQPPRESFFSISSRRERIVCYSQQLWRWKVVPGRLRINPSIGCWYSSRAPMK